MVLRAFIGRGRDRTWMDMDEKRLAALAWEECARFSGLSGTYDRCWVKTWEQGIPCQRVGHRQWLEKLGMLAREFRGSLAFAGAGYGGVGLADCAAQARAAAERILADPSIRHG